VKSTKETGVRSSVIKPNDQQQQQAEKKPDEKTA